MKILHKSLALCALALCLTLTSCTGKSAPKQTAADSPEEAMSNFLTHLQNGEFDQAKAYLEEGNPLRYVFSAEEDEAVPELDAVYRQFREKMTGFTFRVVEEEPLSNGMMYVDARQYDFGSAINAAMLEAMETQCREGGSAFVDYAGWLSQGIAGADLGEEARARGMATEFRGAYHIDHQGYSDEEFMNLITGGFYDYADFQMAVCTGSIDDIKYTYYIAALGDRVVACVQEMSEPNEDGELDDETILGLNEFYALSAEPVKGYYMGVTGEGGRLVTHVGIDFETADQNALVNSGIVSGKFRGNTTTSYLSFSTTISGFEQDGMTCKVTPVYGTTK